MLLKRQGTAASTLAAGPPTTTSPGGVRTAEMAFVNGKVVTVDRRFSIKQAVAVVDGKIAAVGPTRAIKPWIGRKTIVIDLKGKTLLPGINDSHTHVSDLGKVLSELDLFYPAVHTIADVQALVKARAAELDAAGKPTAWIRGTGWNEALLADVPEGSQTSLNAAQLDAVSGEHPVYLGDSSFHGCWVNSAVLRLAGFTAATPDPSGGRLERNPDGSPTGVFREEAIYMLDEVVPGLTREERKKSLLAGVRHMNKYGITSVTEAALVPAPTIVSVCEELARQGAFTARMTVLLGCGDNWPDFKKNLDEHERDESLDPLWLQIPGVKIFADGIPPFKTAWMWWPYLGSDEYGSLVINGSGTRDKYEQLLKMVSYAHGKGYQVQAHCTGDRATTAFIDGVALGYEQYPAVKDTRDIIIHGEFIRREDIKRAAKLGIGLNMQPTTLAHNASLTELLGPELAAYDWCYRSVLDGGAKLIFSSDIPAGEVHPDWRLGMQAAVLREGADGNVLGPEQRVTRREAIRAYTINAAWQDHMDEVKGSIEVGKLADLCVLDGDILACDTREIKDVPVVMTVVGGEVVYDPENGIG